MSTSRMMWMLLFSLLTIVMIYGVFHFRLYKLLLGEARLLNPVETTILCDDQVMPKSYLYEYNDQYGKKMVLYLNASPNRERKVLVIDVDRGKIGVPNTGIRDYSRWGKYLFQNNSGENYIPFDTGVKRDFFEPNLRINKDEIQFNLPPKEGYHCREISIDR